MTAVERVGRTRLALLLIVAGTAIFWAAAISFALLVAGAALSTLVALPHVLLVVLPVCAAAVGVVTLLTLVWRGRFALYPDRVALWIEERAPELRYALVTAIDPRYEGATAALMDPVVAQVDTRRFIRTATRQSVAPAFVAAIVTITAFIAIPTSWKARIAGGEMFGVGQSQPPVLGNRLSPLRSTVSPPAYAHLGVVTERDPTTIAGLIGSRVVISGRGDPDGIVATLEEVPSLDNQNVAVGDSANDDSREYDEAQQARQEGASSATPDAGGLASALGLSAQLQQYGIGKVRSGSTISAPHVAPTPETRKLRASRVVAPAHVKPAAIVKPLSVTRSTDGWSVAFTLADSNPALLRLVDRQYRRSVIIDPRVDQPPTAHLVLPLRDTTLRTVSGTLSLSATFNDDIGLDTARFEYIVCSSGSGDEDFKCKGGTYATKRLANAKAGEFAYSIPFASLSLREGDQLSVRAVVWDHNDVTGPGKGVTETRTVRIARKSEYAKIDVTPAPPSADTALMTLRMLILAVEHLDKAKPVLAHSVYQDSSVKLSAFGHKIQVTINSIINVQSGGGEIPVNPLLALARDSMWAAVTDLQVAETHPSLPPLYATYNALKEFSNAARYYLRGIVEVPVVNIDRVRLVGKDSGSTTPRTPRLMTGLDRDRYRSDLAAAMAQLRGSPGNALEMLALLQVETMRKYPDVATAVGDAAAAIRAKRDPGAALGRARGLIDGKAAAMDTLPLWSGAW